MFSEIFSVSLLLVILRKDHPRMYAKYVRVPQLVLWGMYVCMYLCMRGRFITGYAKGQNARGMHNAHPPNQHIVCAPLQNDVLVEALRD